MRYLFNGEAVDSFMKLVHMYPKAINDSIAEFGKMLSFLRGINKAVEKAQLVIVGDSVWFSNDEGDKENRTLGKLLYDSLNVNTAWITEGGFAPIGYRQLVGQFPKARINTPILFNLNMRSMCDLWYFNPDFAYTGLNTGVEYYSEKTNLYEAFRTFYNRRYTNLNKSLKTDYFLRTSNQKIDGNGNTVLDVLNFINGSPERESKAFYCYPKVLIYERLYDLICICEILIQKNYQPIIYINPCKWNVLSLTDRNIFEENIGCVKSILQKNNLPFFDFSTELPDDRCFTIAEHLSLEGRLHINGKLAHKLKEFLKYVNRNKAQAELFDLTAYSMSEMVSITDENHLTVTELLSNLDNGDVETRTNEQTETTRILSNMLQEASSQKSVETVLTQNIGSNGHSSYTQLCQDNDIGKISQLLANDPKSALLYFLRGNQHLLSGRYKDALSDYQESMRAENRNGINAIDVLDNTSICYASLGHVNEAISILTDLHGANQSGNYFTIRLMQLYRETNKCDKAIKLGIQYARKFSSDLEVKSLLVNYLLNDNRFFNAIQILRNDFAIQKGEHNPDGSTIQLKELQESFFDLIPRRDTLTDWVASVHADGFQISSDTEPESAGAIVMNCNPFTIGHKYLIDKAMEKVKFLYLFLVSEDRSVFPFKERQALVKEGVKEYGHRIKVVPSGNFIISNYTFNGYFTKSTANLSANSAMDVLIFGAVIAPKLGIKHRFVGDEPTCIVTNGYNQTMQEILPKLGIHVITIPRVKSSGVVVSASHVRKLIDMKNFEELKQYVPQATFDYILRNEGIL